MLVKGNRVKQNERNSFKKWSKPKSEDSLSHEAPLYCATEHNRLKVWQQLVSKFSRFFQ